MRFARARKLLCRTQSLIYCLREAPKFLLLRALRDFIFLRDLRVILTYLLAANRARRSRPGRRRRDRRT
jgi:hypothetical protein